MLSQIKNEREGCPLIARTETHTDRERILALLSPRSTDACVRQVFSDIDEINRLMEYYSFRTPQLADRFADLLEGRYRYEIFAIYGRRCCCARAATAAICGWISCFPR